MYKKLSLTIRKCLHISFMSFDHFVQGRFSQKGSKSLPKFTSENLKNRQLEDRGLLLGVISDIHRVRTNPENPLDVRNVHQQHPWARDHLGIDFDAHD